MAITVHVVDSTHGRPAEGMVARLEGRARGTTGEPVVDRTDLGGRLDFPYPAGPGAGTYRLELDTEGYFATLGMVAFQPSVSVTFRVPDAAATCQISVLITPYSHLVYRSDAR